MPGGRLLYICFGVTSGLKNIDPVWDQNPTFFSNLFKGLTCKSHIVFEI